MESEILVLKRPLTLVDGKPVEVDLSSVSQEDLWSIQDGINFVQSSIAEGAPNALSTDTLEKGPIRQCVIVGKGSWGTKNKF